MPRVKKQSERTQAKKRSFRNSRKKISDKVDCENELPKKVIDAGKNFDKEISIISFNECGRCKRSFPNLLLNNDGCEGCK